MPVTWCDPWGKQSKRASGETSNCEILCAGSVVGDNKVLWSLSHGKSSGWWKWKKGVSGFRRCWGFHIWWLGPRQGSFFCSTENGRSSFVRQLKPDWYIDINPEVLTRMNSVLRLFVLIYKLFAPVVTGFIISFVPLKASAMTLAIWNTVSVGCSIGF